MTHVLANLHSTCRNKDDQPYCSRGNSPELTSATEIFLFFPFLKAVPLYHLLDMILTCAATTGPLFYVQQGRGQREQSMLCKGLRN